MDGGAQFVYEGAVGDRANVSYAIARTIDPKCSAAYTACEDIALYKVSCESCIVFQDNATALVLQPSALATRVRRGVGRATTSGLPLCEGCVV